MSKYNVGPPKRALPATKLGPPNGIGRGAKLRKGKSKLKSLKAASKVRRGAMFPSTVLFVAGGRSDQVTRKVAAYVGDAGHATLYRHESNGHCPEMYRAVVYIGVEPAAKLDYVQHYPYVPYSDTDKSLDADAYHRQEAQRITKKVLERL